MKKSLVALAVLAASGASFAQVTIVGNVGMSYQMSPALTYSATAPGQTTPRNQGLQIQDGEIYVTAVEDLGGGWAATARGGWTMRGRDSTLITRDATVSLRTPVGQLTAGALRTCGPIVTILSPAVTGPVWTANESNNNVPLSKCSMIDTVVFGAPVGPVTLSGSYGEFNGTNVSNTTPLGTTAANATGLTFGQVQAVYAQGPALIGIDYTGFQMAKNNLGGAAGSAGAQGAIDAYDGLGRTRIWGSYDFKSFKIGAGYQNVGRNVADQYALSVTVPLGAVTVGMDYTVRAAQGKLDLPGTAAQQIASATVIYNLNGAREGDKEWSSISAGATYAFSKLTTLNMSYIVYTDAGVNTKYAQTGALGALTPSATGTLKQLEDEYRIRLMKAF